ncbi:NAD(P)H-hydrate dehydratase [Halalkalibaculum sp. DA384]|uniref:NAD(P)H-hydrate dehydratase n=1 Tax=Halalkalibaculum sp. DA384 TaxID=3373606 RepID=UPI003754FD35
MKATLPPHPFYLSTAEQSQQMDRATIEQFGIDGFTLMEVAGSSAAKRLLDELPANAHGLYLCGKGNNAGDALVVARYLIQHGHAATLLFISGTEGLSDDTEQNLALLRKIAEHDSTAAPVTIINGWPQFKKSGLAELDFIVDGMLGTGLNSELRGDYAKAVAWANEVDRPIYSIDIPTGLHANTGQIMGTAIQASTTYTFGSQKLGFYLEDGYSCTGEIVLCELPFPNYLKTCNNFLLDRSWVNEPEYPPAKHKYDAGVLYLIAGSEGLTGAAILSARSAWAAGVGAVIIICPRGILPVFEHTLPQIIKKPVGTPDDTSLSIEQLDSVIHIIDEKPGNVLFGPGIGRAPSTLQFSTAFFEQFTGRLLIDADGLWCLGQQQNWQKPDQASWILTPHPGELAKLSSSSFDDGGERLETVREISSTKNITVVSKGFPSVIGTPSGKCLLTRYDTRVFARAGFGDVLAGKIGAYWSLGNPPAKSAALGLLHGYEKTKLSNKKNRFLEPNDLI